MTETHPSDFPVAKRAWALSFEKLQSALSLGILAVQVILLLNLSQRLTSLEQGFLRLAGPSLPEAPTVERTPDERGQVLGPPDAKVTLVVFSDFQCPYCAQAVEPLKALLTEFPADLRLVFRHYPLAGLHADAFQAAVAAECAAQQGKFWEMHDLLFNHQQALSPADLRRYADKLDLDGKSFDSCMELEATAAIVRQDIADGNKYHVAGTPTFFLNNQMVMGVSELEVRVKQALTTP